MTNKSETRLWEKGEDLNQRVHQFTVGDDPIIDLELIHSDLLASAAHAKMLLAQGLLKPEECSALLTAIKQLLAANKEGKIIIPRDLEDCHTTIETELINLVGEAGRRIHTGRSRNDQVMVAVRLYTRAQLVDLVASLLDCAETFISRGELFGHQPMPGYTHFQPAMPASVQMWLQAFGETCLELAREGFSLIEIINSNPLGVASGFGSSLTLDRKLVTKLLGFARVQRNPIAVQNSRGQYELKALRWATDVAGVIEKFAFDMILYTAREFGFFTLPTAFTTGSSIMPQKHNPDVLELLRARSAKARGAETELAWVAAKLPSNYHRDFQYTKAPLVRSLRNLSECLPTLREVVASFGINAQALNQAMSVDLYATYDVYREVKAGKPFRDAYRLTAERVKAGSLSKADLVADFDPIAKEVDSELKQAKVELLENRAKIQEWHDLLSKVETELFF